MAKGTIESFDAERQVGFIQAADGERIHFRGAVVRQPFEADALKAGTAVEYDAARGAAGAKYQSARWVRLAPAASAPVAASTPDVARADAPYSFLNPYNFVRYLESGPIPGNASAESRLLGRCTPPPHDRWVGLKGKIRCEATAVTPVFVADSECIQEDAKTKHRTYHFFRLNGKKHIPGTTLRGAVRSVFEMVTNSCFGIFGGERLSYRLDTRDARRLVPARIEKEGSEWMLRLLTGTAEFEPERPPRIQYAASVRRYSAIRPTGRRPQGPPHPPVSLASLDKDAQRLPGIEDPSHHGVPCWAVLREVKPPAWRVLAVAPTREEAEAHKHSLSAKHPTLEVHQGWLCITQQNADNKHSERFFFEEAGRTLRVALPKEARTNYEDLIRDYQERHQRTVRERRDKGLNPAKPHQVKGTPQEAFSRFILNPNELTARLGEVKEGALVYAMISGWRSNMQVQFIAPVTVPRVAYQHTIANLLPDHLRRCEEAETLCPACRLFGWVADEKKEGEKEGKKKQKEAAYRGRVRFGNGELTEAGEKQEAMQLAILGTPKPTTVRFYLVDPTGRPSARAREEQSAGYDGNNGKNRLRGRKVYRHHRPNPKYLLAATPSDQNRTIADAEGPGARFAFTVEFDNLAPVELGALLWALEVGGEGYHRVGYGKPLGLGSLKVDATLQLQDVGRRYRSLSDDGWDKPMAREAQQQYVVAFQQALAERYQTEIKLPVDSPLGERFAALPNVADLLALVGWQEPTLPVHYPYSPAPYSQGAFEWFVGNKRADGPKIELALATEDSGLPLIDRGGKLHDRPTP